MPASVCAFVVCSIGSLLDVVMVEFGRTICTRGAKRHFSFMMPTAGSAARALTPTSVTTALAS